MKKSRITFLTNTWLLTLVVPGHRNMCFSDRANKMCFLFGTNDFFQISQIGFYLYYLIITKYGTIWIDTFWKYFKVVAVE